MTNYHAYLIRFWREEETLPWRATLVLPQTGEKRSFASIEQVFVFLADQLADKNVETNPARIRIDGNQK